MGEASGVFTTSPLTSRVDLLALAQLVEPNSRVLDVGCGDGSLLQLLTQAKGVDGRGIELSQSGVNGCVAKGLSVIQGDADADLVDYPDDAFDYVILSQTLQATRRPREVIEQMLRIGRYAIVSFPNFGHWRVRAQLMFNGRMPRTPALAYSWCDTPNIHHCTIEDFVDMIREMGVNIEQSMALNSAGHKVLVHAPWWAWNLLGEQALFLLRRPGPALKTF